jgi:transposase-like protein
MPNPYRQRNSYNRVWTTEQKLHILKEYAAARKSGIRGAVQRCCDRYTITTTWIYLWEKQLAKKGLWDIQNKVVIDGKDSSGSGQPSAPRGGIPPD